MSDTRYQNGFVTNVQKGEVPSRYESLARYLAKYVVSPPIGIVKRWRKHHRERQQLESIIWGDP